MRHGPPRAARFLVTCLSTALAAVSAHASPIQWTVGSGGNGHYYDVVSVPAGISWTSANAAASAAGGYLATITSAAENAFIFDNLVNDPLYWNQEPGGSNLGPWLGGYQTSDNGSQPAANWAWVNAEPFSYANWHSGEPNNYTGVLENYLSFKCWPASGCRSGQWNDLPDNISVYGTSVIAYVVEWDNPTGVRGPDISSFSMRASPNPFSGSTRISFTTPDARPVEAGIFDVSGRRVRILSSREAGRDHQIDWDGTNEDGERVPSGIYFCRVVTASGRAAARLVLIH
jgi:hypothetical protein